MKAIGFSIKGFERDLLEQENKMKHQLSFQPVRLSIATVNLAAGYEAVIVFTNDDLSAPVIQGLSEMKVKYLITRSVGTDHIDLDAAEKHAIKVNNVPAYSPQAVAEQAAALAMALARKLIPSYDCCRNFDFRIDDHIGFNFYGKTVGLVGLGNIGAAAAAIFSGMGCRVIGYDKVLKAIKDVEQVSFDSLLERSDIISLHVPLNSGTRHLIDASSLAKMKEGVMLINTSRGGVIKTADLPEALSSGKIGYLGMDVYEFEKGLFFEDHRFDNHKDAMLLHLMSLPNVLISPHQGFLTKEAVSEIAGSVTRSLDTWEKEK